MAWQTPYIADARASRGRRQRESQYQLLAREIGGSLAHRLRTLPVRLARGVWDEGDDDAAARDAVVAGHYARLALGQSAHIEI